MAVTRLSMKNQCYQIIKDKILRREYDLGQTLNIVNLCAELETSNTPVREALSMLEAEGLVTTSPNSQARVIEFCKKDFVEMNETSIVLLGGGYALCVNQNKIGLMIRSMEDALEKQIIALQQQEYYDFVLGALGFDSSMVTATGNSRLINVFQSFSSLLLLMVSVNHYREGFRHEDNIAEHKAILDSIKRQDENTIPLLEKHFETGLYY